KLMLEKLGYQAHVVSGGQLALDWLQQHNAALILLDIEMPQMDGFATLKALRQCSKLDNIPVLALTAHHSAELSAQIHNSGFTDMLTKPVDLTVLAAKLQQTLKQVAR